MCCFFMFFFFFFSSRRRHTRYIGDWSSDVCSSDLAAVTSDGEIIGLRAKAIFDLGAHLLSLSIVPTMSNSIHVLGPYRIQNAELLSVGVYTNTGQTGPYRGSGRPVGVYLIERVLDEAARLQTLNTITIRHAH